MPTADLLTRPVPDALVVGRRSSDAGRHSAGRGRGAAPAARGRHLRQRPDRSRLSWMAVISDPSSRRRRRGPALAADLGRWGVQLDFVRHQAGEPTPVIVHHIRHTPGDTPAHYFTADCPFCSAPAARFAAGAGRVGRGGGSHVCRRQRSFLRPTLGRLIAAGPDLGGTRRSDRLRAEPSLRRRPVRRRPGHRSRRQVFAAASVRPG